MYDLFLFAVVMSVVHVSVAYAAIEIWKLDYSKYLAVSAAFGVAVALVMRVILVGWKDRLKRVMEAEYADNELLRDAVLFFVTLLAGAWITAYLVYRRYGIAGWAGAMAVNYAINWIV
jgi:hypothetical protein